jgi:type IV fimbrial biogenesis protein FimT
MGFSLVELMVTVAVLAVVLAIGFPNFAGLINSNRLTGSANEMVASLQLARSEAIRLNSRVLVCPSANNTSCDAGGDWNNWITVVDGGAVLRVSNAKTPLQLRSSATISGGDDEIVFRPDGLARSADGALLVGSIAACIPTTRPADNVRFVSISSGSRINVVYGNESGACPAPTNVPNVAD